MLSLDECREILGDEAMADDRQLEVQREQAYRLARLLIEMYREQKACEQKAAKNEHAEPPSDAEI